VTIRPNEVWFTCLPRCAVEVPCGAGRHVVRWQAGALRLDSHADLEAERVLAALGGEKARCVEVAGAWGRHTADLTVLSVLPRDLGGVAVSWEDVDAADKADGRYVGLMGTGYIAGGPGTGPVRQPSMRLAAAMGQAMVRRTQLLREQVEARQRQTDLLSLLALGPAFQLRLAGAVVAAHAGRLDEPDEQGRTRRPVLGPATAGRLAPVAERWIGINPDYVEVTLHTGPGWGSSELTGRGEQRRLRFSLPADWLARVWACGLALVGRHLVVAVDRPGWPDARVLALPAPGAEPVPLDVHARSDTPGRTGQANGAGHEPHWEI
jgi:hypothetical protein